MPYYRERDETIATVADALNGHTVDDLKKLCALLFTGQKPIRKGELVSAIASHLEGAKLKDLWSKLDELQQAAIAEVVHSSTDYYNRERFQAKYGQEPNWGTRSSSFGLSYLTTPSLLGLFFYGGKMPVELKKRLKSFVPEPVEITLKTLDQIPSHYQLPWKNYDYQAKSYKTGVKDILITECAMERVAQQDLIAVMRLIDVGKVAVSDKTKLATSATLKLIATVLQGSDYYEQSSSKRNDDDDDKYYGDDYQQEIGYIKAFAWPLLLQAANLAELSGKRLALTKAGKKALNAPAVETIREIWRRWVKTKLFDEFRRIDCIKGQNGKGRRSFTAVDGRRAVIARAMADCPTGKWLQVDEFFRYMRASGYDFEVTREPWDLYISDANYGSLGHSGYHDWEIMQGRYLLCLFFEYAASLGIFDIAYVPPARIRHDYGDIWGTDDLEFFSRYDGLLYFRLNALGAYCLGINDKYSPTPMEVRPMLHVLPNLEIAATGEKLAAGDQLLLDIYTTKISDSISRLDQMKIMAALENGRKISELKEFLEARSGDPLPETVQHFLADLADRAERLQDRGSARLIECADAALAVLIANDSRTKKFCLLAGQHHIVVPAELETQFRRALRSLGYSLPTNN